MSPVKSVLFAGAMTIFTAAGVQAADPIHIAGSSDVFAYSNLVGERFAAATGHPVPYIESNGTGVGFEKFCAYFGPGFPDIANASRRIRKSEFQKCQDNGVTDITEIAIGLDGVVVANINFGPFMWLTREQLTIALAENGPKPKTWGEIDPDLPGNPIEVVGPSRRSGTYSAMVNLILKEGCKTTELVDCDGVAIRTDGVYDSDTAKGDGDDYSYDRIVGALEQNPDLVGIFGHTFLLQNADMLKGAVIENVQPTMEAMSSGEYPITRTLYMYVKNSSLETKAGLREYLEAFLSDEASGADGYLVEHGLIPLPKGEHDRAKAVVASLETPEGAAVE